MAAVNKKNNNLLIFLAIGIILFIDNVDINSLNVALPIIAVDINANLIDMQWVINIYFIFAAAFFMFAGYVGDRWGLKNTLCLGIGLILFSSLIGGLASSTNVMLMSRAMQGIGYAFTFSMMILVTNQLLTKRQKNIGMGIFMAVATASSMVGPVIGSTLTHYIGWPAIFFLNVILCLPCLWILITQLGEFKLEKKFEWKGFLAVFTLALSLLCAVTLLMGLISDSKNSLSIASYSLNLTWVLLFSTIIFLLIFVVINNTLNTPVLSIIVFKNQAFLNVNIFRFLLQLISFSFFFWIPIFLQLGLGYSIIEAGFIVVALTASAAIFSLFSGFIAEKIGHQLTLNLSHLILIFGVIFLYFSHPHYETHHLIISFIIIGAGLSFLYTLVNVIFLNTLVKEIEGMLTGFYYTVSYLAGSLGVIISGVLLKLYDVGLDENSSGINLNYINAMESIAIYWLIASVFSAFFCFIAFKKQSNKSLDPGPTLDSESA